MKYLFHILAFIFFNASLFAQQGIDSQKNRLRQYMGYWVSSLHANTDSIAKIPAIKMINTPVMGNKSMQVVVLQYQDGQYRPILTELIGHDAKSDKIIALGQNSEGVIFKGTGHFNNQHTWQMTDLDMMGNFYMQVDFNFESYTNVFLEGKNEQGKSLWKTRYVKANPKDKNIGIQLVSVHEAMQKNPQATLQQLGRMGYSYVETFVYNDGKFYGMSPQEFKKMVEAQGMQFLGSMTFQDLPSPDAWQQAMDWWEKCIEDHLAAGVEYLTTSNNQLKPLKTKEELQRYCDYYNAIGKLCKEKGLTFAFHNHADEFANLEDVRIYDYFLEHTDPEYVHFQADIYWMHVGGVDPVDYFTQFPNRFISWHIKDYKELGASGKIDWRQLFYHPDIKMPRYKVAEVEDYSFPPLFSVQLAWEYLYFELLDD